ncbi:MAG TPA: hypothetical protein DF383_05965 [Deltaproteobacteria bacterium]|nr:hypothetical protein [Deltaproteobacteria bacterium]
MQDANLNWMEAFLDVLRVERHLAKNTVESYRRDLLGFIEFVEARKRDFLSLQESDLREFLSHEYDRGQKARSTARRLTTLRMFYRHALKEKWLEHDPTVNIELPKLGRALPHYLTLQEIESLLAQPDLSTPLGRRDRAMLELLYASGMRCAELVAIDVGDLDLDSSQ